MTDYRLYFPYTIGTDSPINYLFEKISAYLRPDRFEPVVFSADRVTIDEHVTEVHADGPLRNFKLLATSLRRHDLIHTGGLNHYPHSRLARLRNPSLKHLHTFRVDVTWPEFPVERERRMVEMADQLTAVSEHTARTAEKVYDVSPEVIYNGVDATEFHPRYERPDLFDRRDIESPLFVFVGRFEPRKHPQDVVEVARAVPEAEFLLFGDGPLFEEVTEESSSLDNVHLLGRVPKATLPAVYANANGLVFPTVHEGCPNVVLEAMASATPVVGYTATSMPELVSEGETGYLADPEDVSGLVERTRRLLDADTAATLGRNARRYVENEHDFEAIAKQYERLYLELLE